jgi:Uma2 family endonuclease
VYNSDAAARLSASRFTYPDATVTCDERDRGNVKEVQSPRVIVEVVSDTTEAYDRGSKFGFYRACPAVEEYVLVAGWSG